MLINACRCLSRLVRNCEIEPAPVFIGELTFDAKYATVFIEGLPIVVMRGVSHLGHELLNVVHAAGGVHAMAEHAATVVQCAIFGANLDAGRVGVVRIRGAKAATNCKVSALGFNCETLFFKKYKQIAFT
jgi:hypothetical protein